MDKIDTTKTTSLIETAEQLDSLGNKTDPVLDGDTLNALVAAGGEPTKSISAQTLARMAGLVTTTDLRLVSGKIDLALSKIHLMTTRLEKVLAAVNAMPTGSDLERIDVQIGALRTLIKDALTKPGHSAPEEAPGDTKAKMERMLKGRSAALSQSEPTKQADPTTDPPPEPDLNA